MHRHADSPTRSGLVQAMLLEHSDAALTAVDEALALLQLPELISLCKVRQAPRWLCVF